MRCRWQIGNDSDISRRLSNLGLSERALTIYVALQSLGERASATHPDLQETVEKIERQAPRDDSQHYQERCESQTSYSECLVFTSFSEIVAETK